MLQLVLQVLQPATADLMKESQLVADLFQSRIPFKASIFVRDQKLGGLLAVPESGDEPRDKFIWDESNNHTDRE